MFLLAVRVSYRLLMESSLNFSVHTPCRTRFPTSRISANNNGGMSPTTCSPKTRSCPSVLLAAVHREKCGVCSSAISRRHDHLRTSSNAGAVRSALDAIRRLPHSELMTWSRPNQRTKRTESFNTRVTSHNQLGRGGDYERHGTSSVVRVLGAAVDIRRRHNPRMRVCRQPSLQGASRVPTLNRYDIPSRR